MSDSRIVQEFAKHPMQLRRAFNRMEDEQKLTVMMRKFNRHLRACEASDMATDPRFLPEVVEDVRKGFEV